MNSTFLYDGDCAFCTTCARFIQQRVPTPAAVMPWQFANLAALGVTREACLEAVQWIEAGRPVLSGPDAIGALLRSSNRVWKPLGWLLRPRLVSLLAWPVYRLVARYRHRLPGGTAACAIPADRR